MRSKYKRQASALLGTSLVLLSAPASHAGTATWDFTTDPTTGPNAIQVFQTGFADSSGTSVYYQKDGGNPGGFLGLTWPLGSSSSIVLFPDIDGGKIVTTFTFETDLRIGNPQQNVRPADGFSINFARANDPVFQSHSSGDFATGGAVETGTQTGIAISFDTWQGNTLPDGGDIEGIIVRVDNVTILRQGMPTRNGDCNDTTSLQTGPRDVDYWNAANAAGTMPDAAFLPASWTNLCWQHLKVELDNASKLTVTWKGNVILDHFQTTYFPSAGGLILAGRTGGADEHTHFDNIKLTTSATAADTEKPTTPANLKASVTGAYRVVLSWDPSTDNSGRVGYEIEQDGTVLVAQYVNPTAEIRGLAPNSSHTFRVRATDVSLNKSDWVSVTVKTVPDVDDPNYAAIKIYGTTDNPISGTTVDALLSDSRYPASPDRTVALNNMWMSFGEPLFGNTYGDNLGYRIAGTLTPAETAQYRFFVRSDDSSQLYLNTTGATIPTADGASQIAEEPGCCAAFQEPGATHTDQPRVSDPISLTAGKTYGILFLVKEGGGGDWGQVAWRKEGTATPAASLPPLGAPYFQSEAVPKVDPVGADVSITQQPQAVTSAANEKVSFSGAATFTSPYTTAASYQWLKDGKPVPGGNDTNLTFNFVAPSDAGKYTLKVSVPGKSVTSSEAALTVTADTKAPTLVSPIPGQSSDTFTEVTVKFSEPVDATTGAAAANYAINNGATVSAAKVSAADPTVVVLTTSKLDQDKDYTLTINNVMDTANNKIAANTTANFHSWALVAKRVKGFFYNNITGTAASDLTSAAKFPSSPDAIRYFDKLEAGTESGNAGWADSYGDNYGGILNAWLIPTETASYTFFIRSDDASQLFVGSSDTFPDPKTAAVTAEETGCCKAFLEPGNDTEASVTSAPISLTAGKKYGVTVLWKEGGGGDGVAVGWRKAGDTTAAGTLPPITDQVWYYGPTSSSVGGGGGNLSISGGKGSVTITFTGTLQSADKITGPWTNETGPSPKTVTPSGAGKFYRSQQ